MVKKNEKIESQVLKARSANLDSNKQKIVSTEAQSTIETNQKVHGTKNGNNSSKHFSKPLPKKRDDSVKKKQSSNNFKLKGEEEINKKNYKKSKDKKESFFKRILQSNTNKASRKKYSFSFRYTNKLIAENARIVKSGDVEHLNPDFLIKSLHQFIRVIRSLKMQNDPSLMTFGKNTYWKRKKLTFSEVYKKRSVLIYSDSKYVRTVFNLGLQKLCLLDKKANIYFEVGGSKELVKSTKMKKRYALIIFLTNPTKSLLKFCLNNRLYVMSMFGNLFFNHVQGTYSVPLPVTSVKHCIWLLTLLNAI